MNKVTLRGSVLGLAVAMASGVTQAGWDDVRVNAFATLGVASMHGEADSTRYGLNSEYKDGESVEAVSRGAVQLGYDFTDKLSGTLQLLADRGGDSSGVDLNVDWAFLTYQATDALALRGGKLRIPVFMFSETIDVGYSYPWVRPPQTFYQLMPFTSHYAVDALWNVSLGGNELLVQPLISRVETNDIHFTGHPEADIDGEDMVGLNLVYNIDYGALRVGYFHANDGRATYNKGPLVPPGEFASLRNGDYAFLSAGYNLEIGNWVTAAEYGKADTTEGDVVGSVLNGVGLRQVVEEEGVYLMVGHRFGDLLPHITYAKTSTTDTYTIGAGDQESLIVGLRYDWKPGIALKAEYENIQTDDSFDGRFYGLQPSELGNRNADIFTIAIDYVL